MDCLIGVQKREEIGFYCKNSVTRKQTSIPDVSCGVFALNFTLEYKVELDTASTKKVADLAWQKGK